MTRDALLKSVASFAKAYINDVAEQTSERKQLIRDAAFKILGTQISNCDTCMIESLLKLYKMSDIKSKYLLRHGALLEVFSRADLAMTVHNTTDDLAELHLALNPGSIKYFDDYPKDENGEFSGITQQRGTALKIKFGLQQKSVKPIGKNAKTVEEPEQTEETEASEVNPLAGI